MQEEQHDDLPCGTAGRTGGGWFRRPAVFHHRGGSRRRTAGGYRPHPRRHLPGMGIAAPGRHLRRSAHLLPGRRRGKAGDLRRRTADRLAALGQRRLAGRSGQRPFRGLQPLQGGAGRGLVRRPGPDPPHRGSVCRRPGPGGSGLPGRPDGRHFGPGWGMVCRSAAPPHRVLCPVPRAGPQHPGRGDQCTALLLLPPGGRHPLHHSFRGGVLLRRHPVGPAHRFPARGGRPPLEQGLGD